MNVYFQNKLVTLYHGDSREALPTIQGATAIVTDPPYHLTQVSRNGSCRNNNPATPFGRHKIGEKGFMGKTWDGGGISFDPDLWKLCLDAALPGAYLMAFGGCRTYHRIACAIEDGGWDIFQQLQWIFGSGFPKSRAIGKAILEEDGKKPIAIPDTDAAKLWEGYGSDIKPAHEPICLARKPLDGTYAQNAIKHGCGGLNIDECKVGLETIETHKTAMLSYQGSNHRPWHDGHIKTTTEHKGRWPANVVLSYPEEEYILKDGVTPEQKRDLFNWMNENA